MPIVDQFGRPIDRRTLREPQTARAAWLQREFDDHPARGQTPTRQAALMEAAEQGDWVGQLELADDMEERDAHIFGELHKRRGSVSSLEWTVEAPDNADAAERRITAQVREWLGEIHAEANGVRGGLELVIASATDAILKGFAPQEMVWRVDQGVLLPDVTAQPQRWFTASADRRHLLLRSQSMAAPAQDGLLPVMGEPLQPFSWVMHVHPARSGYVGRMSLARVLAWPYLFKNYAVRDLAEFLEIYGIPPRIGTYPAGASEDEKRTLLRAVTSIGHNAAGILPAGMELDFKAAAEGTEEPFVAMWDRMEATQSKAILGQTLSAQQGASGGSLAMAKVHNEVRMDIRAADVRLVEGTLTRQLVYPLVALNVAGANLRRLPRVRLDMADGEDLGEFAEALPKLAAAGLQIPVKWAQARLRIPEPTAQEPVMHGPQAVHGEPGAEPAPRPARAAASAALAGAAQAGGPPPDLVDELVAEQAAQWQPLLGPMVSPLLAELERAAAAGESLADFAARLPELVQRLDTTALAESLARSAFAARLAGEADLGLAGRDS